jgi:hypothetical protein
MTTIQREVREREGAQAMAGISGVIGDGLRELSGPPPGPGAQGERLRR